MRRPARHLALAFGTLLALAAAPLGAQEMELTTDVLDRFVTAYDKEKTDLAALEPELAAVDEKIRRFRECKIAFEAAGSASGSRLGGLAARAGIRARCGANNEAEIRREKKRLGDRVTAAAAAAGTLTVPQFTRLKTRLERIYAYGDRAGLKPAEVTAIDARRERFASIYGGGASADAQAIADALAALGASGARTTPGQWNADVSWMYVSSLFGMMYATGANLFDNAYEPGQWTRWTMKSTDRNDRGYSVERAFLARAADGGEWWRFRSISGTDTVVMEALFKRQADGMQEIVRMRGKMPGEATANEMMVPENMSTVSTYGGFGMRPTKESVDGATVGTENVTTPAGTFSAKLVRFGSFGGRQEWWLVDNIPGGWVRYKASQAEGGDGFTMELVAHGTGARSELGVP
jgi:hypothetical protein